MTCSNKVGVSTVQDWREDHKDAYYSVAAQLKDGLTLTLNFNTPLAIAHMDTLVARVVQSSNHADG